MAKVKKVDMFQADKAFSARVNEFMRCKVWNITLKTRMRKEVEALEVKIQNVESLRGSIIDDGDKIDRMKAGYREEIAEVEKKYQEQLEKEAKFDYTDADRAFYKDYAAATDAAGVMAALRGFCTTYGLTINDTNLEQELVDLIGGGARLGASAIIRSKATKFTKDKRSKVDVLTLLYGRIAEKMLQAGTLKPQDIPADIAKAYAKKSSK